MLLKIIATLTGFCAFETVVFVNPTAASAALNDPFLSVTVYFAVCADTTPFFSLIGIFSESLPTTALPFESRTKTFVTPPKSRSTFAPLTVKPAGTGSVPVRVMLSRKSFAKFSATDVRVNVSG